MTFRTTFRAAVAALALGAVTLGSAAVTPAAAGFKNGHGHHNFFHGHHNYHFGFGHGYYYPYYSFYGNDCFWQYKKIFVPGAGFIFKKVPLCY
jgi:hypothetical protein